ncbi:hypothetical protein FE257_006122 [Aspergillus nanangensis]|uniref:Uncharacterized protein n=1 Tax=Aspergillus nanangensis TaxID=2582783 RepID=A0AAD4CP99_ASPNN|nr:hypothetical protein FE257_006122 [Aspergillus nanangensis]
MLPQLFSMRYSIKPALRGTTPGPLLPSRRTFQTFSSLRKTKGQQQEETHFHDRTSLNPQRSEVSKTGTDDEVAAHDSAFDPSKPDPESTLEAAEEESRKEGKISNPLNVSPANKDVSKPRGSQEGGPDRNAEKAGPSSRGWTKKHREVDVGKGKGQGKN